jgi:nicotinamidase-related amidase
MQTLTLNAAHSHLVLVDYQARLMPHIHEGPSVLTMADRLARAARALGVSVVGTEQNPQGLGQNVSQLRQHCASTLPKMHFDACKDGLLAWLPAPGQGQVVLAGCEAHVCLLQTALGLRSAGHAVWLVADASGSRTARNHALAMERARAAGVVIVSMEMVVFEWLESCQAPQFKQVLGILKD